jgi:predicted nucleic acid-binding protein
MQDGPVIVNNTPLVAFWVLRRFELLEALFGEVLTPAAVHQEFLATERIQRQPILAAATWIRPIDLSDPRRADTFVGIGRGEAEVLALAQERRARLVVIDDRRARRFARRLGIPLTGTLGVLLLAKEIGLVAQVRPLIQELQQAGLFFAPLLIQDVLTIANESDP